MGESLGAAPLPTHAEELAFTPSADWSNFNFGLFQPSRDLVRHVCNSILAVLLLVLLSPLLILIAILIKCDSPGGVLFRQERRGRRGDIFRIYKFRTMYCVESGQTAVQCKKSDLRVTRLGAFLRRTSMDELPQLINIARGEMAIVGPRPHPLRLDDQFGRIIPFYYQRYMVVPGLTGLAQVRGFRGPTDTVDSMAKRIESDLEYVGRRSVILDFCIIGKTIPAVFSGHNAF